MPCVVVLFSINGLTEREMWFSSCVENSKEIAARCQARDRRAPESNWSRIINGQKCMQVKVHNAEKQLPDKQLSGG